MPKELKEMGQPVYGSIAQSIAEFDDPTAIPFLIAAIDAEDNKNLVYGIGYYGLCIAIGHPPLTDVKYDESHNGTWWKQWWEENKKNYPEAVQNIPIPSVYDEWNIPDLSKEVAPWQKERSQEGQEEKMFREIAAPDSDIRDVPAERLHVEGNEKMRYFLIGVDKDKPVPESGYRLVVVMPGGNGDALFHPFIRRMWKYAMKEKGFIIAQPVAVRWTPNQYIVWATERDKLEKQEFSTEKFVESVIADVSKRVKVDPNYVFTFSWSSSGPAAYAIALQEKTAVTGSYILMSVFKPEQLPPLEKAKGRLFAIQHSPDDRVCPFRMAKEAEQQLTEHGAAVKFTEYNGGHGWHGNIYGLIRENLDWLVEQRTTSR
jgi:predicted esterase